jgi:hypothetical protein
LHLHGQRVNAPQSGGAGNLPGWLAKAVVCHVGQCENHDGEREDFGFHISHLTNFAGFCSMMSDGLAGGEQWIHFGNDGE